MTGRAIIIAAALVILSATTSIAATEGPVAGGDVSADKIDPMPTDGDLAECQAKLRYVNRLAHSLHRMAEESVSGLESVFRTCGWMEKDKHLNAPMNGAEQ